MDIFQTVRTQCALLGISPSHQSTQRLSFDIRKLFGFLLFGCVAISDCMYFFRVASGFMESMDCISASSGSAIVFVSFATIVSKGALLFESIDNTAKLIERRRKYPKSIRFFLRTSQQVERLCEIAFIVVTKISLQCVMLPTIIVSFGTYIFTDLDSDSFQLPIPMWFPFDSRSPVGYLIAVTLEYIVLGYEYFIIACILTLGIATYYFAVATTKETQHILRTINKKAHRNKNQANKFKNLFTEFIEAHGIAKQVELSNSELFQPIFMSLFTWSLFAISSAMLIVQVEILHHGNVMPLLMSIVNGIAGLVLVFIVCELGQRMSDAFDKINFTMDRFDWHLFPIEIKRILPAIIAMAQRPVTLECFGSIICTRDVFKNVVHCALSYFMVLRQLSN